MKKKKLFQSVSLGLMVLFSVVLVACGRDVSTVEDALEGHWTVEDARLNGEPLEEALDQYGEMLAIDSEPITSTEEGQTEIALDFYYHEDNLTIVNNKGEQTVFPSEVINRDEENNTLVLEHVMTEEQGTIKLNEEVTFADDERESLTSHVSITDIDLEEEAPTEERSGLEEEMYQWGRDFALEIYRNIHLEFDLNYVDDEEAPTAE
jgi:hypothetical protein